MAPVVEGTKIQKSRIQKQLIKVSIDALKMPSGFHLNGINRLSSSGLNLSEIESHSLDNELSPTNSLTRSDISDEFKNSKSELHTEDPKLESNDEYSPCISPSSSVLKSKSSQTHDELSKGTKVNKGPTYERKLLKKINGIPNDVWFDYHSDDEAHRRTKVNKARRTHSLDRKIPKKEKISMLHRNEEHSKPKGQDSFPTSPKLNTKIDDVFKLQTKRLSKKIESAPSSSAENEKEERQVRKVSVAKRKHNSLRSDDTKDRKHTANNGERKDLEQPRKSSKFRRRKHSADHSRRYIYNKISRSRVESIGTDNLTFKMDKELEKKDQSGQKPICIYSGAVSERKLRSKKYRFSNDLFADIDEYSSANSDIDSKTRKQQRGFAQRVWRSINSLFQTEDKTRKETSAINDILPLRKHISLETRPLSRSFPGTLDRAGKVEKENDRTFKDDMYLLRFNYNTIHIVEKTLTERKINKRNEEVETNKMRSKSLEVVPTNPTVYDRRESFPIIRSAYKERMSQFNIITFQSPSKSNTSNEPQNIKTFSFDKLSDTDEGKIECTLDYLTNLKSIIQLELKTYLTDKIYHEKFISNWCRVLSESIKNQVIKVTKDSYKVAVQVFIGALCDDGIHAAVQSSCDGQKDGYCAVTYKGKDMFAIVAVLAFDIE